MEPGHRGVYFNRFNGVEDSVRGEGWHFQMPFLSELFCFDITEKSYELDFNVSSRGFRCMQLQLFTSSVTYRPCADLKPVLMTITVGVEAVESELPELYRCVFDCKIVAASSGTV